MQQINIHEAKTHLSRLIEQTISGQEIIIAKHGKPVARLVPYVSKNIQRTPGGLKTEITITKDFDAPLPEDIAKSLGII